MTAADGYTEDVLARIQEYFSPRTAWQRTLWSVGPASALRELIESADGVQIGALSKAALKRHAQSVHHMLADDPAAGETTSLPRVKYLEAWDERNLSIDLSPQWVHHRHTFVPASPRILSRGHGRVRKRQHARGRR